MTVFVDFNGYLDKYKNFTIKECYVVSLLSDLSGYPIEKHLIYKEESNYKVWPEDIQTIIKKYHRVYGIPLENGKHVKSYQKKNLRELLRLTQLIYVSDLNIKKKLRSLVGNDLEIEALNELGYHPSGSEYVCEWHNNPNTNRCAKGRGVDMCHWYIYYLLSNKKKQQENESQKDENSQRTNQSHLPLKKRKY